MRERKVHPGPSIRPTGDLPEKKQKKRAKKKVLELINGQGLLLRPFAFVFRVQCNKEGVLLWDAHFFATSEELQGSEQKKILSMEV